MKLSLKLFAEKVEDNMTVRVNPNDVLLLDGKNFLLQSPGEVQVVIASFNTSDSLWHGYGKKFKGVEFK